MLRLVWCIDLVDTVLSPRASAYYFELTAASKLEPGEARYEGKKNTKQDTTNWSETTQLQISNPNP
jgi:hypothetical protein